jgi:predicted transcriptional regulator
MATKVCPFCKEEIREDAIKCRYCMSSLLPPQAAADTAANAPVAGKNQTVYVVDQGLIQFGKFAAGVLAIFIAVGIYLYGVDIKESLKDVESSTKAARDSAKEVQDSADKVKADSQKAQEDLKSAEKTASASMAQTQTAVGALQQQVTDIQAKQTETSNAAAKAEKVEKSIEAMQAAAKQELDNDAKNSAQVLASVQSIADRIAATGKEVDNLVPHIKTAIDAISESDKGSSGNNTTAESEVPAKPAPDKQFTPLGLAAIYKFPTQFKGVGQSIGLIELGGGYRDADLAKYFRSLGVQAPKIIPVGVDGGANSPSTANSADGEVEMNIEVIGAVAPGAHIVVYFCPNTNQGYVDAVLAAVHDNVNRISVLSISWGSAEPTWTPAALQAMNTALKAAADHGITVLVASGDSGATDGMTNGQLAVDFPASSPWVTAVGGTHLHASNTGIESEYLWDDGAGGASGRGTSNVLPIPDWQARAGVSSGKAGFSGRAIPDVAADASPNTGYIMQIDGTTEVLGGTAASTPLWAALIALINEGVGHNVGFLNPVLYEELGPSGVLRQVDSKQSSSSAKSAPGAPKWSPLTGWGTPDGQKLLEALQHRQ